MLTRAVPQDTSRTVPVTQHIGPAARYFSLLTLMSKRNFQVRYKRAFLGIAWAIAQPALQAVVLSFVIVRVFKAASVPDYGLYLFTGTTTWAFFTTAVSGATTSVVANAAIVKKVAIPRTLFPVTAVGGTAITFAFSFLVLMVVTFASGHESWRLLLVPLPVAMLVALAIGLGSLAGAFHPAFRDVSFAMDSFLFLAFYATPVLYDLSRVPVKFRSYAEANPMAGVLSAMRWCVLGRPLDDRAVIVSVACAIVLPVLGTFVFRRRAADFADLM